MFARCHAAAGDVRADGLAAQVAGQRPALGGRADSGAFDPRGRAVPAYTDAMTHDVQVPPDAFDAPSAHFDAKRAVDLAATIAAHSTVSCFLEALQIRSDDARPARRPDTSGSAGKAPERDLAAGVRSGIRTQFD
jgi:alkylhydroperoxidase family enzyme